MAKGAIRQILFGVLALSVSACGRKEVLQQPMETEPNDTPGTDAPPSPLSLYPDLGPCPDDGPRLTLSRVCAGRAINYITPNVGEILEAPEGCSWNVRELPFATDVLLYRALDCGDDKSVLSFSAGAHAGEASYLSSALHEDWNNRSIVRVYTDVEADPDYRMKASMALSSDAGEFDCEINPAGEGYPEGAVIIEPALRGADTDCGAMAVSNVTDNFWTRAHGFVFAFSMPRGERDIDPASFTPIEPK